MTTIATMPTGPALFVRGIARTVSWGLYDANEDAVTPTTVAVSLERNGTTVQSLTGVAGAGTASTSWTPAASTTLADDYVLVWTITETDGSQTIRRQVASVCLQELLPVIRIERYETRVEEAEPYMPPPAQKGRRRRVRRR